MILLDTSVLVDFLRGLTTIEAQKFTEGLGQQIPFGLCPMVYQEVLMGARDETEWQTLDIYLSTQRLYDVTQARESYRDAARIY